MLYRRLKEGEKGDKCLHLASEQKKQWNIRVTILPIVVRVHVIVPKNVKKRLNDL